MKAIIGRLRRLEVSFAPKRNEQGQTVVQVLQARQARRIAKENSRPYEEVLREIVIEHQAKHEAFMATYHGNGTISDILRHGRAGSIGC